MHEKIVITVPKKKTSNNVYTYDALWACLSDTTIIKYFPIKSGTKQHFVNIHHLKIKSYIFVRVNTQNIILNRI